MKIIHNSSDSIEDNLLWFIQEIWSLLHYLSNEIYWLILLKVDNGFGNKQENFEFLYNRKVKLILWFYLMVSTTLNNHLYHKYIIFKIENQNSF